MRKHRLLILLSGLILLFIASCKTNVIDNPNPVGQTGITGATGQVGSTGGTGSSGSGTYSLTETFESGAKGGYADGTVVLSTGTWDFNDALIGNTSSDAKDGNWSTRLRTGSLGMNFDINGITQISIKHAKYGTDANTTWQLMMSTDGGTTYTNVGTAINETSTTLVADSFKVSATKARFKIVKASATVRINLDDINFKGTGDPGVQVIVTAPVGPDTSNTSSSASTRGITKGTDAPPTTGDNSNLLFGNPTNALANAGASGDNYLLDQGYYTESYNNTRGTPNWVSWHLDQSNTTNSAGRGNDFAGFSGFPTGLGINWYVVQSNSYAGSVSGFDRGHNCPSADRTSSVNANSATFLMTNMIPQAPQNNQQTWGNLENFIRGLIASGQYEAYIVMGNYGTGGTGAVGYATTINSGHITVPTRVWKVAIIIPTGTNDVSRVTSTTRIIAVDTPNDNSINQDWTQYITTMGSIETNGNVSLFSALPKAIHDALATVKDSGK